MNYGVWCVPTAYKQSKYTVKSEVHNLSSPTFSKNCADFCKHKTQDYSRKGCLGLDKVVPFAPERRETETRCAGGAGLVPRTYQKLGAPDFIEISSTDHF